MLQPGKIFHQRYHLKEALTQNAGRQTWKADDISTSPPKTVIVKLLAFNPQMQWDDLKLFEREASVLQQLNHPSIPQYHEYFSVDEETFCFCLVQDYIPGHSLDKLLLEDRKFTISEVNNIAVSILKILIYLHELSPPVLHRDIKPSNVILGTDGNIYLVDFGAVQSRAALEGATFTVVGTYGYTPIEQFGGRAVPASDLYALGATLAHLLTGIPPADLPQKNMGLQFREYLSINSHLVDWIEILVRPSVEQRFQTARQALEYLNHPYLIKKSSLTLEKPISTRIKIKKTFYRLDIRVLGRKRQVSDNFIIAWILILYISTIPFGLVTFPFVIVFWLIGLIPVYLFICPLLGEANLNFNRRYFLIKWKFLGLYYRSVAGHTPIIQEVYIESDNSSQINKTSSKVIVMRCGSKICRIGSLMVPISTQECHWLAQEIKDWLGLTPDAYPEMPS